MRVRSPIRCSNASGAPSPSDPASAAAICGGRRPANLREAARSRAAASGVVVLVSSHHRSIQKCRRSISLANMSWTAACQLESRCFSVDRGGTRARRRPYFSPRRAPVMPVVHLRGVITRDEALMSHRCETERHRFRDLRRAQLTRLLFVICRHDRGGMVIANASSPRIARHETRRMTRTIIGTRHTLLVGTVGATRRADGRRSQASSAGRISAAATHVKELAASK